MKVQIALIDILKTHQDLIIQRWTGEILKEPWTEGIDKNWLTQQCLNPLFLLFLKLLEKPDKSQLESQIQDIQELIRIRIEARTTLGEISDSIGSLFYIVGEIICPNFPSSKELDKLLALLGEAIRVFITTIAEVYLSVSRNKLNEILREIKRLAILDELTGLFNRRKFDEVISHEAKRAIRYKHPVSFLMLDVDHFKTYNDKNGHLRGDSLLKEIAHLVLIRLRSTDYAFRYGGEEFAVLLPETEKGMGAMVAERIRKSVEETDFEGAGKMPLGKITVSIGVAACPEDAIDVIELIDKTDKALYEAKNSGRNRVYLA